MSDFETRLKTFLHQRGLPTDVFTLTPDASTREYYRIYWNGSTAIACVYPEGFIATEQSYLDVTALFATAGIPVASVHDHDEELGIIILEDLGDTILRNVLIDSEEHKRESLLDSAISLIPRIQAATGLAFETGSIASKLSFDREKLLWELDFFKTHYFTTLKKQPLSDSEDLALLDNFTDLAIHLESKATVLCHRDYHAANLMVMPNGELKIIDHQDARIGSVTYDLVSLLLDRVTEIPSDDWIESKIMYFLSERDKLSLPPINIVEFDHEVKMQTVQRCLKAIGTFSFQSANRGKDYFLPFIKPMFQIVEKSLLELKVFPKLTEVVVKEANEDI